MPASPTPPSTRRLPSPRHLPWELAARMGVAAGLGLFVAHVLDLEFPVYVLLAVATVASTGATSSLVLGGYRLAGTLLAIPLAIFVVEVWSVTPLAAGLVTSAIVLLTAGLGLRDATRLTVLVFAVGATEFSADVGDWAEGRLVATVVGAAVTLAVCAVPLPGSIGRWLSDPGPEPPRASVVGQE